MIKAHQRKIRDDRAASDPRPVVPLDGCYVKRISYDEAESVILKYEWLRTMPTIVAACYGLIAPNGEILGAAVFGYPPGSASRDVCGKEHRKITMCLERGACVHFAHEHAGSFLISRAVKLAAKDFGWRIFFAYHDKRAGEFGTLYQACNWLYIGISPGRNSAGRANYTMPDGKVVSSKRYRAFKAKMPEGWNALEHGWTKGFEPAKGKYVFIEAPTIERKRLRKALRYPVLPYPKRETVNSDTLVS